MASCVLFTPKREEGRLLLQTLHNRAAYLTNQAVDCYIFQGAKEAVAQLRAHQAEAIVWDASQSESLSVLPEVRLCSQNAFLLIVASANTSPLGFLRPDIAPSSLILRPLGAAEVNRVACEILRAICGGGMDSFVIERRGERQQIPWEQIYYFESRGKRIYARLRGEEIGFTGTLESLAETLPENYRRCHRSFIVNVEKIDRVRFAENLILLWDGLAVPLSRSYKRSMKERESGQL